MTWDFSSPSSSMHVWFSGVYYGYVVGPASVTVDVEFTDDESGRWGAGSDWVEGSGSTTFEVAAGFEGSVGVQVDLEAIEAGIGESGESTRENRFTARVRVDPK